MSGTPWDQPPCLGVHPTRLQQLPALTCWNGTESWRLGCCCWSFCGSKREGAVVSPLNTCRNTWTGFCRMWVKVGCFTWTKQTLGVRWMVKDCRRVPGRKTLPDVAFVVSLGALCVLLVWHPEFEIQESRRAEGFCATWLCEHALRVQRNEVHPARLPELKRCDGGWPNGGVCTMWSTMKLSVEMWSLQSYWPLAIRTVATRCNRHVYSGVCLVFMPFWFVLTAFFRHRWFLKSPYSEEFSAHLNGFLGLFSL